jgi:hypothetical protein
VEKKDKKYKGCYSCVYFLQEADGVCGKCLNPVEDMKLNVKIEYVMMGLADYPNHYYPTALICFIDNCQNWKEKPSKYQCEEIKNESKVNRNQQAIG